MSPLFGKQKPPEAQKPQPLPAPEQIDQAGEAEMRRQRRKAGFESTFLTGNLVPKTNKKTVLG